MKTIAQCKLKPVWVNPDHLVETARYVMAGHRARTVGVLSGTELVGLLSVEDILGKPDASLVRDHMQPVGETVTPAMTVREAAQVLILMGGEVIPVRDGEQFCGVVTASMLLADMSRTWDPLTELPWSDLLRDWGVEQLKEGQEITILFLDLDDFGTFNKEYGHTVGDRVLQAVAHRLKEAVDAEDDVLVRYGGDEFAVGTKLLRADAEALAGQIKQAIDGVRIEGTVRPVTVTVGVFGGRRTHERESIHYASTIDSLINHASRACMFSKRSNAIASPEPAVEPIVYERPNPAEPSEAPDFDSHRAGPPENGNGASVVVSAPSATSSRLPIVTEVFVDDRSDRGVTMVTMEFDGKVFRGVHARSSGISVVESVAQAAASAINRWNERLRIRIGDATIQKHDGHLDRVLVRGWAWITNEEQPIMGEAQATRGIAFAAAEALLATLARNLN